MISFSKTLKKLVAVCITGMLSVFILMPIVATASDNNIDFNFWIKANQGFSHNGETRYRSTNDVNNAWKVNFKATTESDDNLTSFHLGIYNSEGTNQTGSKKYVVQVGTGAHYYPAYQRASDKHIYLYARNNSNTEEIYTVSGYWDEETGVTPD